MLEGFEGTKTPFCSKYVLLSFCKTFGLPIKGKHIPIYVKLVPLQNLCYHKNI